MNDAVVNLSSENDVGKSAQKIPQILEAFRDAHKSFETLSLTLSKDTNLLGSGNLARITQKVRVVSAVHVPHAKMLQFADFGSKRTYQQAFHLREPI